MNASNWTRNKASTARGTVHIEEAGTSWSTHGTTRTNVGTSNVCTAAAHKHYVNINQQKKPSSVGLYLSSGLCYHYSAHYGGNIFMVIFLSGARNQVPSNQIV
jgi:hypothetical protein